MRLTGIGSQYLLAHGGCGQELLRRRQDLQGDAAEGHSGSELLVVHALRQQTRSMLDTPQRYPRAGSQSYPSPAAEAERRRLDDGLLRPDPARGRQARQLDSDRCPDKGWFTILRLYSPLEPFFTKEWRPSEIELVP